jgi:hypothetical protein
MRALSVLGHLIYNMAKKRLAAQGVELKGHYNVIAHDSGIDYTVGFMIDCQNAHQLTDADIEAEKIMLRKIFADYINEARNA